MSESIYQNNLEGYQKCGDAYTLHHTDPAMPCTSEAPYLIGHICIDICEVRIQVGSILLVPVFSPAHQHLQHLQPPPDLLAVEVII